MYTSQIVFNTLVSIKNIWIIILRKNQVLANEKYSFKAGAWGFLLVLNK